MSRILEKLKKLVSKLPSAEQDEFFEFVVALGEDTQSAAEPDVSPPATETAEVSAQPPEPDPGAAETVADEPPEVTEPELNADEPPVPDPEPQAEQPIASQPEQLPQPEQDSPDEGEFYDGAVEDIPQIVKSETDESAIYDANADNVEMYSGDDGMASQATEGDMGNAEQGDIIASLQAKITALEAENAQMKAKFSGNFGFGNAPSMARGRYQTRDDFIRSLPQVRKG